MPFKHALILGGVPSLFMFISTCVGLGKEVPDDVSGALQHFAAGVLLCTVATELLPEIVNAEGLVENLAAFLGFFSGVAVLILLGMFSPDVHGDHKEDDTPETVDNDDNDILQHFDDSAPTPGQRQQLRQMKFVIAGRKFRQRQFLRSSMKRSMSLSSLPLLTEGEPLIDPRNNKSSPDYTAVEGSSDEAREPKPKEEEPKQFPLAFVLAIAIDSSLDGLLIGIASAAGPSAGPMMSASLSVEMSFLGLTLATNLYGQPLPKAATGSLVGPVCLLLAAGLGGAMADVLGLYPAASVGMMSFGASALLFMVAEELLLDAHEDGEHVWWVDLQLYTGFFASIMAGKFAR